MQAMTLDRRQLVVVNVGETVLGLPIASVRQIIRTPTVNRLPGARPEERGIANVRGEFIAVLDLRLVMG